MRKLLAFCVLVATGFAIGSFWARSLGRAAKAQVVYRGGGTIKLGKGVVELPPGTLLPTPAFTVVMHSPVSPSNGPAISRGAIPVRFTATHRGQVPPPDYQIVVSAENMDTREIAAVHEFDRYVLPARETRTDEFATTLEVPPGLYALWIELRSLRPTRDIHGHRLGDYLVAHRSHRTVRVDP
jgi:hypothetical protein